MIKEKFGLSGEVKSVVRGKRYLSWRFSIVFAECGAIDIVRVATFL